MSAPAPRLAAQQNSGVGGPLDGHHMSAGGPEARDGHNMCWTTSLTSIIFLDSMLPQYMATCVSFIKVCVSSFGYIVDASPPVCPFVW